MDTSLVVKLLNHEVYSDSYDGAKGWPDFQTLKSLKFDHVHIWIEGLSLVVRSVISNGVCANYSKKCHILLASTTTYMCSNNLLFTGGGGYARNVAFVCFKGGKLQRRERIYKSKFLKKGQSLSSRQLRRRPIPRLFKTPSALKKTFSHRVHFLFTSNFTRKGYVTTVAPN